MENSFDRKSKTIFFIVIIIAVIAGLYFRLIGLGKYPLAVDEYYIMQSVHNILNFGLPKFNFGGYYDRGILYQYLVSLLLLTGVKAEFAGRIIPVITNLITLIPLYLLAKKISGKTVGLIVIFAFCFSVWEIEMARFARMYSPFQMVFMFYMYFLYKYLFEDNRKAFGWMLILSFLSLLIYEGSIFLAVLNFIPFFWNKEKKSFAISEVFNLRFKIKYLIFALLIFIAVYFYISTNFRTLGTSGSELLPSNLSNSSEWMSDSEGIVRLPKLLILTLFSNQLFTWLFIIPMFVMFFSIYKISKNTNLDITGKFSFILLIFLSLINIFGLALATFIIFYLTDWIKKKDLKTAAYLVLLPILLNLIFWTVFALKTDIWHQYFPSGNFSGTVVILKVLWKEFVNYPYLYETFVLFRDTIPIYTYLIVGLLFGGIILSFFKTKGNNEYSFRIFFALFIFIILMVNILNLTYFETRYFLFLFPLTLILAYSFLIRYLEYFIKRKNLVVYPFLILFVPVFAVSEDFNLKHLLNINTDEINYRFNFSKNLENHYYTRWDTRTPAEIVNKESKAEDIIIVTHQSSSFYLNRLDYVYIDYRSISFKGVSISHGKQERWTGAKLIYDYQYLIDFLENHKKTKWLIVNMEWGSRFLAKSVFFEIFNKYLVYSTPDSTAILYKIPSKPNIDL